MESGRSEREQSALLNYVHIDDVVKALILCGTEEEAIGNTYNISQSIHLEQMVQTILNSQQLKRRFHHIPESLARGVAIAFGWIKSFPLTTSRIDALTNRCVYDSSKIQQELKFQFESTLEERFQSFAAKHINQK